MSGPLLGEGEGEGVRAGRAHTMAVVVVTSLQAEAPAAEYLPAAQSISSPEGQYFPARQSRQLLALAALYVPAGHAVGVADAAGQYLPASHAVQEVAVAPRVPRYVPAEQFVGTVMPAVLQRVPGGHCRQAA